MIRIEDHERVEVEAFGRTFYIQPMAAIDRDRYERDFAGNKAPENWRAKFLALCIRDAKGKPIWDADDLGGRSAYVIAKLFDIAQAVNGYGSEALENAEGKSEPSLRAVSHSG